MHRVQFHGNSNKCPQTVGAHPRRNVLQGGQTPDAEQQVLPTTAAYRHKDIENPGNDGECDHPV
jgi:hypothetical protein